VGAEIRQRLWNTTQLVVWAILLSLAVAVTIGVICASRPDSIVDHVLSGFSFLGLSMPAFWFALLAIEWLVFQPKRLLDLEQPILFSVGLHSSTSGIPLDYLRHLILPVLVLSLPLSAVWSRYVRASMLDVMSAPYIRMARAKGVPRRRVLVRHALRNALIPFTTVSAVAIGHLFGGVIVTESIFAWPGMGQLFFNALLAGDTNVVLPWLMVAASFVLLLVLISDILLGVLDPRVRAS
jgi:peptide/nickel transport system permease protein